MHWVAWLIIILLVSFITWLLLVILLPMRLEVDSEALLVSGSLFPLLIFKVQWQEQQLCIRIRILGIQFTIPQSWMKKMSWSSGKVLRRQFKKKERRRSKKGMPNVSWRRIVAVIRSFQFKYLDLDIDTGDFYYNALLLPVLQPLNGGNRNLRVNFEGRLLFQMCLQNSIARMLWAFIFKS